LAGRAPRRVSRTSRLPKRELNLPNLDEIVAINRSVRHADEWFADPDELDRIKSILQELRSEVDPIAAAAIATSRIARTQAFTEGNKRTALLVGRWILDRNGQKGDLIIPKYDLELANLLLKAARGSDVGPQIDALFKSRR
jgi:hypothetical protein